MAGGAYAAVSTIPGPDGVIHGCYAKKNGALRVVKAGSKCQRSELALSWNQQGQPGPIGSGGALGAQGAAGANGKDGTNGNNGNNGANFFVTSTLQSGQTESGIYAAWGGKEFSDYMSDTINFRIPLVSALSSTQVSFLTHGQGATASCPGPGNAAPGHLCVYETAGGNDGYIQIYNPAVDFDGSAATGFDIVFASLGGSPAYTYGTWTVTAP